jgi:hypothetical protein
LARRVEHALQPKRGRSTWRSGSNPAITEPDVVGNTWASSSACRPERRQPNSRARIRWSTTVASSGCTAPWADVERHLAFA